jgi:hypothetical protein
MFLKELTSSKYAETTVLTGLLSTVAKAGESNGTIERGAELWYPDTHRYTELR